jgi:hypothetical protein
MPRQAQTENLIGVCCSLLERHDDALDHYRAAIEQDPAITEAYANAGWSSLLLGDERTNTWFRDWLRRTLHDQADIGMETATPTLSLDNVTLCCVDCAYYDLAAAALKISLSKVKFADAIFFSDRDCQVEGVRFVETAKIASSADYSNFVMHELHEHVSTEFVLIIQYDGFILNPSAWDPEFLQFDYIGAKMRVDGGYIVGNGGFSLRSRKLLHALRDDDQIKRYDAHAGPALEDIAICRTYRDILESRHKIRFGSESAADGFAAEHVSPTLRTFGFHNLLHLVGLYQNRFQLPQSADEGVVTMAFRAPSELGMLAVQRQLELQADSRFWSR